MTDLIIAMPSMTLAQKSVRVLSSYRIHAQTVNIDPSLTKRGCGYGISLSVNNLAEAKRILDKKKIDYGDVIGDGGGWTR